MQIIVLAALISADGLVLLTRRMAHQHLAGLWGFPGGKIEADEQPATALCRELSEELAIDTVESCLAPVSFATAHDQVDRLMLLYGCRIWQGNPRGCDGQELRWANAQQLATLPMPEANRPLLAMLREFV